MDKDTKFEQKFQGYTKIFVLKNTYILKKEQKHKNTAKDRTESLCNDGVAGIPGNRTGKKGAMEWQ